ncbi:uncharacterized protein LOC110465963 [Mizuhopecten yessoensis]|uniref:Uncharacterized protein n=1 Tax=Mizuhopecten yessoensis TaxID=6573 RepID=A0A210PQF2_MIZYE|nr:uncharacterized protein LOC110465963 [Mizuhopecten yessoensis]OWF38702.1 hypothetical protein KP79_PYT23184 [Mizuhopecten yessoensis]
MATEEDERKLNKLLQINGLKESLDNLQNLASDQRSEKAGIRSHIAKLKQRLCEAIKDPEKIFAAIAGVLGLMGQLMPLGLPFTFASAGIKGLLMLFTFLSKKSSKMKVIEQQTYLDADTQKKVFAVHSALSSSLHYLKSIHQRKLNAHEIDIVLGQVPRDTGTEFLGVLEYKIKELQNGKTTKQTGKKEKKETEEKEEDTLQRCNAIIALIDLYCVLSCLREFVMYYLVTLLANNRVPENITESYLERREHFKNNREAILKVLHEPEAKDASVSAVFNLKTWPKLSQQLESRPDLSDLIDRPWNVVSASNDRFAMFRCSPNTRKLFTLKRYVRVKTFVENTETKFLMKSEGNRDFTIHLCEHDDFTWKMSGDLLEASGTTQAEQRVKFNIVRLSNGNVMFSSKNRPTCFVKMENAKDDARLSVANNSFDETCQWKLQVAII